MSNKLIAAVIIIWLLLAASAANAQQPSTTSATTTGGGATTTIALPQDANETRQQLREVLHRLPPEVGRVLKIDASLWTNEAYIKTYPQLEAFLAQHPEVARNPHFYTRGMWIAIDEAPPENASVRLWRQLMEGFFILFGVSATIFVFTWIIRTVVEHRRWSRLAKVQAEVHNKLLDRFGSNEDVMRYIETTAGKKFLEAAPIPLEASPRVAVSAPVSRVLWSVQAGVILGAAGIGLRLVSVNIEKEVASALSALGVLAIAIGAGFIVSAVVSYLLSRKLGIWQPTADAHE